MIQTKLQKAAKTYQDMYEELLNPIGHLNDLGMDIPEGFRVCAKYTLLSNLEEELEDIKNYKDTVKLERLQEIKERADKFKIKLYTPKVQAILTSSLTMLLESLNKKVSLKNTNELLYFFELLEKLSIHTEISNAQNDFYELFCNRFEEFCKKIKKEQPQDAREILLNMLEIGKKLNINVNFYKEKDRDACRRNG